jgi:hypothetical protein
MEGLQASWSPGNGTVYDVVIVRLVSKFQGHGPGTYMATISNLGRPTVMFLNPSGGFLTWRYVAEKTGLNERDCNCVTEMLAAMTGREPGLSDQHLREIPRRFEL